MGTPTSAGTPNYGTDSSLARDVHEQSRELLKETFFDVGLGAAHPAVVLPAGRRVESLKPILDQFLTKPERRKGTIKLSTQESLIAISLRFASDASVLFANPDPAKPSFTIVFDYTPPGEKGTDWHQHRAVYAPILAEEWAAWREKDGEFMPSGEFAAFIEERIGDLVLKHESDEGADEYAALVDGKFASPSELLVLSRGLEVNVNAKVKQATRLSSGEISVVYDEAHVDGDGRPIRVPQLFLISIPVFYGGDKRRIVVRLRYRVTQSGIMWAYQLVSPDAVFTAAIEDAAETIQEGTELPLFFGSPE